MAQTLRIKRTATATNTLADAPEYLAGELGLNTTDKKLWVSTADDTPSGVVEILTEESSIKLLSDVNSSMSPNSGDVLTYSGTVWQSTAPTVYDETDFVDLTSNQASIAGNKTFTGDVSVANLTVTGTTTTIDTTNLLVEDKNITIGDVVTPSDTTADGGGITLKGATDKTITWDNATDAWLFNQGITVTGNISATNLSGSNTGDEATLTGTVSGIVTAEGTSDTTKFLNGNGAWSVPTGGASELKDLTDVDSALSPTDGQLLAYDLTGTKWEAIDNAMILPTVANFTATLNQTTFTTNYSPSSVEVYYDGIKLRSSEYTASNGTSIILDNAADTDAWIQVRSNNSIPGLTFGTVENFTATASQTTFTTPYNVDKVEVYAGGVKVNPNDYTATNGTSVILDDGVDAGTWVQIRSDSDQYIGTTQAWTNITGTPSTLTGYGITETDIDTVGTITTGTWTATAIADAYISSASSWNAKLDPNHAQSLHATDAISIADHTITLTRGNGTTETVVVPDNNTTYVNSDWTLSGLSDANGAMSPTDGQVLTFDTTNGWQSETVSITESQISDFGTYLTGLTTSSIEDLSDVNTMTPTDGQVLTWDNNNSRWDAQDGSVVASIKDLTDVFSTMTPTDGQVLTWDNANSRWDAAAGGGGGDITEIDGGVSDSVYESTATVLDGGTAV